MINGIESVVYTTTQLDQAHKFFTDFGLTPNEDKTQWLTQCGANLQIKSDGPLEITFGVGLDDEETDLVDPNGFQIHLRKTKKQLVYTGLPTNSYSYKPRINQQIPLYGKPNPVDISHIVLYTNKLDETEKFYTDLGFVVSDRFAGMGVFLRCSQRGLHHTLLIQQKEGFEPGINHVALSAKDVYDVFASGMYVKQQGWNTKLGPGRHIISSAFFWYFENPIGGALEFVADEDFLTEDWQPRTFEYTPEIGYEWKIW